MNAFALDLSVMLEHEARELLLRIANPLTILEANTITKLCGYLPSAITKAGLILREYPSVKKYIDDLSLAKNKLPLIEATTSLSYNLLKNDMKTAWRYLSIFPDDFSVEAASAVLMCSAVQCNKILLELNRLSLINKYHPSGLNKEINEIKEERYRFHDLDRAFAQTKLKNREQAIVELRLAEYFQRVMSELNGSYTRGGDSSHKVIVRFDREWNNIKFAQHLSARLSKTNEKAAAICLFLSMNSAELLDIRLPKAVILNWSETALKLARRLGRLSEEGVALNNLANAYSDTGEFDRSIPYFEKALQIARDTKDLSYLEGRLGGLGNVYRRKGDYEKSLKYHKESYEISVKLKNRFEQTKNLHNLGNVYSDMREMKIAFEYRDRSLRLARNGKFRVLEAYVLVALAADYLILGDILNILNFLKYSNLAMKIIKEMNLKNIEYAIMNNYGNMFEKFRLKPIARYYHHKAEILSEMAGGYFHKKETIV